MPPPLAPTNFKSDFFDTTSITLVKKIKRGPKREGTEGGRKVTTFLRSSPGVGWAKFETFWRG